MAVCQLPWLWPLHPVLHEGQAQHRTQFCALGQEKYVRLCRWSLSEICTSLSESCMAEFVIPLAVVVVVYLLCCCCVVYLLCSCCVVVLLSICCVVVFVWLLLYVCCVVVVVIIISHQTTGEHCVRHVWRARVGVSHLVECSLGLKWCVVWAGMTGHTKVSIYNTCHTCMLLVMLVRGHHMHTPRVHAPGHMVRDHQVCLQSRQFSVCVCNRWYKDRGDDNYLGQKFSSKQLHNMVNFIWWKSSNYVGVNNNRLI